MNDIGVLVVSSRVEDHLILRTIWRNRKIEMEHAWTCAEARRRIRETGTPVVVCACKLWDGSWADVVSQVRDQPHPPVVVVLSDRSDIDLWMEILHKGAYDALAKPFDCREAERAILGACREARNRWAGKDSVLVAS